METKNYLKDSATAAVLKVVEMLEKGELKEMRAVKIKIHHDSSYSVNCIETLGTPFYKTGGNTAFLLFPEDYKITKENRDRTIKYIFWYVTGILKDFNE